MKVLFCTDGSDKSYNAITNFANWFNNLIVDVLCVSDITYFSDEIFMNNHDILEKCSNSVDTILKNSEEILKSKGIPTSNLIKRCGSAVDNILEVEKENKYEFVVMGSNGKQGIQKWLGSVSQEVAYKSKTRVYISKSQQTKKNILFPIFPDLNEINDLKKLLGLMNLYDAQINLITIYQIPDFLRYLGNSDLNWLYDVEVKQQKEAISYINIYEKLFTNLGISVKNKFVKPGEPFEEIINFTNNEEISLTVLGMKKFKSQNKYYSTSKKILEYGTCDIIIDKNI